MEAQSAGGGQIVPGTLESRSNPRVGVDLPVDLYSGDFRGALAARTRDLGVGGLCVATDSVVSLGSIHRVVVRLADGALDLKVVGKWQTADRADDGVLTGLQFVDLDEPSLHRLWDVLVDQAKLLARFLYGNSDLADFGPEEAMGLAHVSRTRELPAGYVIYGQDESTGADQSIFLVQKGRVVLEVRVRGAIRHTIDQLGPGRLFGGMPLVADAPNAESAVSDTPVELLEINRGAYRYLCVAKPWLAHRLAYAVTRSYARRTRDLLARLRDEL